MVVVVMVVGEGGGTNLPPRQVVPLKKPPETAAARTDPKESGKHSRSPTSNSSMLPVVYSEGAPFGEMLSGKYGTGTVPCRE